MNDAVEPRRPTRPGPKDTVIEAFSKDLSPAMGLFTSKPTGNEVEANAATSAREIRDPANVTAVDAKSGQLAMADTALAVISTMPPSAATLSTANPGGIKVEGWSFRFMLLIAFVNQNQPTANVIESEADPVLNAD